MVRISDNHTSPGSVRIPSRRGWLALSPVILFLLLYVAVSLEIGRAHV